MMLNNEREATMAEAPDPSGLEQTAPGFAWGYFIAIVVGTVIMIAIVCTIATLSKKQEADFSACREATGPARLA